MPKAPIVWFEDVCREDVAAVGGKNASVGEMVRSLGDRSVRAPPGFATVAEAYWRFLEANGLNDVIESRIAEFKSGKALLAEAGAAIRSAFLKADWPSGLVGAIGEAYVQLCQRVGEKDADVAVRSSATAEDLPDASFAGQQETFLNIRGGSDLLNACRRCFASLFTDRAISYREAKRFDHPEFARCLVECGVDRMSVTPDSLISVKQHVAEAEAKGGDEIRNQDRQT